MLPSHFKSNLCGVRMDKFGYIRGRRGPPGPPGKNAIHLPRWCPKSVLDMFRNDEECTYFFNTDKDGILFDGSKPIGLKDRYGKNNAICEKNFGSMIKVGKVYGIQLKNSLFKIPEIGDATKPPSTCVIALEFKVSGDGDGYIVCNDTLSRGVRISKESMDILGTDPLKLKYDPTEWNTLVIQYSNITNGHFDECFFDFNDRRGSFIPHINLKKGNAFYIGGHPEKENFASVTITNLEIYYGVSPLPDPYILPQEILVGMKNDLNDKTD